MSLGKTPPRRMTQIKLVSASPEKKQHREREGEMGFTQRIESLADHLHNWYLGLEEHEQRVYVWQEQEFERNLASRKAILANIAEGFEAVDLDSDGIINNI